MADQAPIEAAMLAGRSIRPIQRFNWGFVPIPKHCRYDPNGPTNQFKFTMFLNVWFGLSATLTVANSESRASQSPLAERLLCRPADAGSESLATFTHELRASY